MFPLKNKLFITTRPTSAEDKVADILTKEGATVVTMPTIEIKPLKVSSENQSHIFNNEKFSSIIFTSRNGVKYFFEHQDIKIAKTTKTAVIGNSTAKELLIRGYKPDYINNGNTSTDFVTELQTVLKPNENVLLIQGNLAPSKLQNSILKYANCTRVDVYQTLPIKILNSEGIKFIEDNEYNLIFFSSPSGFQSLISKLNKTEILKLRTACIGKTTAQAIEKVGVKPILIAQKATAEDFAKDIIKYYTTRKNEK